MKVLVTGSSGLIGTALVPFLKQRGHAVRRLLRSQPQSADDLYWDPLTQVLDKANLEGLDAVVHLAGESIGEGRWDINKKARIRVSRIHGTRLLCEALCSLSQPPKVLVSASASGYYGNRGTEILREESGPGTGFLAELCVEWEAAAQRATEKGIRVVNPRFGLILSPKGGALAKMLPPFKLGIGGKLGSGEQYWSWIAIEDAVGFIHHALVTESLQGPVNAATADPVTNAVFTKMLAKILCRPAIFPVPAFGLRKLFGEMADEMLLTSFRMEPARLVSSGFAFLYPELEGALYHLLR